MNENNQVNVEEPKLIDVDKVIGNKNPRLLKVLPRFLINYLKRILHQDKLNGIINRHKDKVGIEFIDAVLREFNVNLLVRGEGNVEPGKDFVVVSNHPLGGLDGMALMLAMGRINPKIAMTANDFLMHLDNLKTLFIPVNKHGSNYENVSYINQAFESDRTILFFPAGLCSRKVNRNIIDLEWKKTFLSKAKRYKRDILPVHISGRNSNFFYNLANIRKKLGVKINIEMLYLVDEMFKQDNKDIVISFGKPISSEFFDKRYTDAKWVSLIREHVYRLKNDVNAEFSPI
jgi:putative hemolysin